MATATGISIDEYLRTSYEGLDREYRDGEVIQRTMPDNRHSLAQVNFSALIHARRHELKLFVRSELRVRLSERRVLIPDVCMFKGTPPTEPVPTTPPYVVAEIASPDDKLTDVLEKLEEYADWGVHHIWLVDPRTHKLFTYSEHRLHEVIELKLEDPELIITAGDIFSE